LERLLRAGIATKIKQLTMYHPIEERVPAMTTSRSVLNLSREV